MGECVLKKLDLKEVGLRVRLRRERLELSREELAEKINRSPQFISDIEYGHKGMSVETLYSISQALEMPADYFLTGAVYEAEEMDQEAHRFREEISMMLNDWAADDLRRMSQVIHLYEDGIRVK